MGAQKHALMSNRRWLRFKCDGLLCGIDEMSNTLELPIDPIEQPSSQCSVRNHRQREFLYARNRPQLQALSEWKLWRTWGAHKPS